MCHASSLCEMFYTASYKNLVVVWEWELLPHASELSIPFYLLTGALSWLPSDGKISLSGRYFFIKATILSRIYSCRELKKNGPYSYHNEKLPFSIFTWSSLDWFHTLWDGRSPVQYTQSNWIGNGALHNELWTLTFEPTRGSHLAITHTSVLQSGTRFLDWKKKMFQLKLFDHSLKNKILYSYAWDDKYIFDLLPTWAWKITCCRFDWVLQW